MKNEDKLCLYKRKSKWIMPPALAAFILSMLCLGIPAVCLLLLAISFMLFGVCFYFKIKISLCKKEIKQGIVLTEDVKHIYGLPLEEKLYVNLLLQKIAV